MSTLSVHGSSSSHGGRSTGSTILSGTTRHHHGHHHHHHHHGHSHRNSPHPPTAATLEPPPLFAAVEQDVYRFSSIDLTASSFPFLRTLNLKKILLLSAEPPSKALLNFANEHGVQLFHHGLTFDGAENGSVAASMDELDPLNVFVPTSSMSHSVISERTIKSALEEVLDVRNHPIAICDTSGMHETGVLVGCLRRVQRWNFSSILTEYRSFAGSKARAANERFIETFDVDSLELPREENAPFWVYDQADEEG